MTLAAGSRLGPYEILAPIGAGGMGEVYRARDTRLERSVAIKVLPQHLSASAEVRQRFEREAKTISQLSHPHICALYDVGREGDTEYLVMELLEGEALSDRLARGPLTLEQTLRYGVEIADALDKAHRQGIVHRDLKPGNVMLTKSGVKLLDFGLAKAMSPAAPAGSLTALPTQAHLTQEGTILGTFQYMAPEQLEGREADARTDIFAFGSVLYEMATGKKAFAGSSQASLASAILRDEPKPISTVQPTAPHALDRVVKSCLAKDPEERWQSAGDVAKELRWIAEGGSLAGIPPIVTRRKGRERLAWGLAAAAFLVALATVSAFLYFQRRLEPLRMVRSSILLPEKLRLDWGTVPIAVSPEGSHIAFAASDAEGKKLLWVRPLDALSPRPLPGTEGAYGPFWSPDGRFLGFFAGGKLKKVDASGGPVQTLCDALNSRGGTWNRDGEIVFAQTSRDPLHRVPSTGGAAMPVTKLDSSRGEISHRWPLFLPDGRHFLYLGVVAFYGPQADRNGIYIASLDSKEQRLLLRADSNVAYAPPGFLLFFRDRTLMAQPFDADSLRLTGEALPVAERVRYYPGWANGAFSVSQTGVLAYQGGGVGVLSQLAWFDRSGKQLESVGATADYVGPRLSHDGRRVAVTIFDHERLGSDIWLYELSRRVVARLTFDSTEVTPPIWSPDDGRIVYRSSRGNQGDLYQKEATAVGSDEVLLPSTLLRFPTDWSTDGRFFAFQSLQTKTQWDLWFFSVADRKAAPFLETASNEWDGQFSPDGRWLAYVSDESGRPEVYVQHFPQPGGKRQISTAGGTMPKWRSDGTELYYLAPDQKLMVAQVKTGTAFEAEVARPLFDSRMKTTGIQSLFAPRQYDVTADGQRFLINTTVGEDIATPITLVLNWTAGLKR